MYPLDPDDPLRSVERGCHCSCCDDDKGNTMVWTFEHTQSEDSLEVVMCQSCLVMAMKACLRASKIYNFVPLRDGPMLRATCDREMVKEMAGLVELAEGPDE